MQRDTLSDQAERARERITTLTARIEQIDKDAAREAALNRDAGETIGKLNWEQTELEKAGNGHTKKLTEAEIAARNAGDVLSEREAALTELTEDVARLAARHQSAERLVTDHKRSAERAEAEQQTAASARAEAEATRATAEAAMADAKNRDAAARIAAEAAEADLTKADAARSDAQTTEIEARAALSEADGEVSALSAEVAAISRLLERDTGAGGQILDQISVDSGLEAALGAALSDDLKYPETDGGSGWTALPGYDASAALPSAAKPLADFVRAPKVLDRRLSQTGLVEDETQGKALQPSLQPGQRIVSSAGDLWRWDGFAMAAQDRALRRGSTAATDEPPLGTQDRFGRSRSPSRQRARRPPDSAIRARDRDGG